MSNAYTNKLIKTDYSDLYFDSFNSRMNYLKEDFLNALFFSLPGWLENYMVKKAKKRKTTTGESKYHFFDIIEVNDYEIILSYSGTGFDYSLSIALFNDVEDKYTVLFSSKMNFKKIKGKLGFYFIKPVYIRLIKKLFADAMDILKGIPGAFVIQKAESLNYTFSA
jgi:hypothetical protein